MKQLAWKRYNIIVGVHSTQSDVDHNITQLGLMSESLKRVTDWLVQPVIKSLACAAFSTMELYNRQAAAPQHDISSEKFQTTDNPAEGCHLRRQSTRTKEPLSKAIVSSYASDDLDWQRWTSAMDLNISLDSRTQAGRQRQKEYQAKWRETKRKEIHADVVRRDGPEFGVKKCGVCQEFILRTSDICTQCGVPVTARGALAARNTNMTLHNGTNLSMSNQLATSALWKSMAGDSTDNNFVVADIWGKRTVGSQVEYLVQWSGYSKKVQRP